MQKVKIKQITENLIEVNGIRYIKEESKDWLDIPELGISVELNVHDKNKSFEELGLKNRESELLTVQECIFLANSKHAKQLKIDGSSSNDDFFIQQPLNLNRKSKLFARLVAGSGRAGLLCDGLPGDSNPSLGVRFKKKFKK